MLTIIIITHLLTTSKCYDYKYTHNDENYDLFTNKNQI